MKVKNGIASSVSFSMIWKTRCGRAWKRVVGKSPSSMPIRPNIRPFAARAKATG